MQSMHFIRDTRELAFLGKSCNVSLTTSVECESALSSGAWEENSRWHKALPVACSLFDAVERLFPGPDLKILNFNLNTKRQNELYRMTAINVTQKGKIGRAE